MANAPAINEADVADYLRHHPDFFRQHPGLLGELSLPHVSGNAVSLVEKQVAVLRERGINARRKLGELVDNARENDDLFTKTQSLVVEIVQAQNLADVLQNVEQAFRDRFDVEYCSIAVLGPEHESGEQPGATRSRSLDSAQQAIAHFLESDHSICSALRPEEAAFIFGEDLGKAVRSAGVALRDIGDNRKLLLAVGHRDGNHYNSNTGTLFLDYIAEILQVQARRLLAGN